jgi:hypothetical protein
MSIWNRVLLPDPLGPTTTTIWPYFEVYRPELEAPAGLPDAFERDYQRLLWLPSSRTSPVACAFLLQRFF